MRKRSEATTTPETTTKVSTPVAESSGTELEQYKLGLKIKSLKELHALRSVYAPSSKQYILVQRELEARGTADGAVAQKPGLMSADFEKIVTHVYQIDATKEYERLESQLTIGEDRGDFATVLAHLDHAEDNARRAHKLVLTSKVEQERWLAENEPVRAAMWGKAERELQAEKAAKDRNKAITNEDVRMRCIELFRDEFQAYEHKRARVEGTVKHIEKLCDLWVIRCRTLQVILGNLRKG